MLSSIRGSSKKGLVLLSKRFFRGTAAHRDTWNPFGKGSTENGEKVANPSSVGFPDFIDSWGPKPYKKVREDEAEEGNEHEEKEFHSLNHNSNAHV